MSYIKVLGTFTHAQIAKASIKPLLKGSQDSKCCGTTGMCLTRLVLMHYTGWTGDQNGRIFARMLVLSNYWMAPFYRTAR